MKTCIAILVLSLARSFEYSQDAEEILANENIISLSKIGLDTKVIIFKLESSKVDFDVSTDGLIQLGEAGVNPNVITAMMTREAEMEEAKSVEDNADNPLALNNSGFYVYIKAASDKPLIKLDPTGISDYSSSGGNFGGFGKTSSYGHLAGLKSRVPITDDNAEFYFHLNPNDDSESSWWWNEMNPNDFILVKLREKGGDRIFEIGSSSSGGFTSSSTTGIPAEDTRSFEYKEAAKGIYLITFPSTLESGEYMFMCTESTSEVYTFSMQ